MPISIRVPIDIGGRGLRVANGTGTEEGGMEWTETECNGAGLEGMAGWDL